MGLFSLPTNPKFIETYISGFPFCRYQTPITIEVTKEGLNFKILIGFKSKKFTIPKEDIIEIGLNQDKYRSGGKAAAGAIIGGVLTGGVGLLAGAALGGRRRQNNELTLELLYENEVCFLELKSSKTLPKLYQEIKKIMPIERPNHQPEASQADELMKFAELKEKGLITDEEFEAKKKQILSS